MNELSLNSVLLSLSQHLNHADSLVDGRTQQEFLNFIASFGRLLNFFNKQNEKEGSWEPFILKDPVFLVASIGQTPSKARIRLYQNACAQCLGSANSSTTASTELTSLNPLFNQVFSVFDQIRIWSAFMVNSPIDYKLKRYVIGEVECDFAAIFWALIELNKELSLTKSFTGIAPIDQGITFPFENELWATAKNKQTYWDVLGLQNPITENDRIDFAECFEVIGTKVLYFYGGIVNRSAEAFRELSLKKVNYPDTLLLRTFLELLKVNQSDLNALTGKHLDFYYTNILKQKRRAAQCDSVYICANLAGTDHVFNLKKGTAFKAGLDKNKAPILFDVCKDQLLNPAKISTVYTLFADKPELVLTGEIPVTETEAGVVGLTGETTSAEQKLFQEQHKEVGVLKKDENGVVQNWNTFGAANSITAVSKTLGISFASPLLLLNEGVRTLSFKFEFVEEISPDFLKKSDFFLSTKKEWFPTTIHSINPATSSAPVTSITITFQLKATDPPIERFEKNPDGYVEEWPLFKICFNYVEDLSNPPLIKSLLLTTSVEDLKTLIIGNDNGALTTSKPFMPFGPVVVKESSFYMGSTELFSKPLSFLSLNFKWDKLPKNFATYYGLYNAYLNNLLISPPSSEGSIFASIWKGITKRNFLWKVISGLFKKSEEMVEKEKEKEQKLVFNEVFNNSCFKVGFQQLAGYNWSDAVFQRDASCSFENSKFSSVEPLVSDIVGADVSLFNQTNDASLTLAPSTTFSLTKSATNVLGYNSALQGAKLALNEKTADGFIKVSLSSPVEGFGHALYPKVISQVTLVNAQNLIKQAKGKSGSSANATVPGTVTADPAANPAESVKETEGTAPGDLNVEEELPFLLPVPNPPFAPIMSELTANYQAEASYDFNYDIASDPIQCYHYANFNNYLVYDSTKDSSMYPANIGIELCGKKRLFPYLPTYPGFDADAVLYLEMEKVIPGNPVTIFIELNQSANPGSLEELVLNYYYLSDSDWKPLELLFDETKGLKCSGTMTFEFPADMNTNNLQMIGDNYWLGITLTGNPDLIGQTTFLKTNGIRLQRGGTAYLDDTDSPKIVPETISSPEKATPEISNLIQPFASFGGRPVENDQQKNLRIANRLKIKGRPITVNDFNRCIKQDFNSIFYSKVNLEKSSRTVFIRLVKKVESAFDSNAFLPMVSACEQGKVETTLKALSGIDQLQVKNFEIEYLIVNATVYIQPEYDINGASNRITQALKVFLSPWVQSNDKQLEIDQGVNDAQMAAFFTAFQEVSGVEDISFQLAQYDNGKKIYSDKTQTEVILTDTEILLVPNVTQKITWKKAV